MEILPGIGLPVARVGQTLRDIVAVAGPPALVEERQAFWHAHSPPFAAYFDDDGRSEIIEVYGGGSDGEGVTIGGVQLTLRLMEDVEADLARSGLAGRRTALVIDFDDGFTLWSLGELSAGDLELGTDLDPGDQRVVVEGVAIGPFARR